MDERWIPKGRGYSLYLRPTMIGTQESLGVGASNKALIFVIASPVGPYFPSGFNAVNLLATSEKVRAWPGGTGDAKVGGNYAPCIRPQLDANKEGYQQNLWLFGPDHQLTEVGTMNCFVYWKNEKGGKSFSSFFFGWMTIMIMITVHTPLRSFLTSPFLFFSIHRDRVGDPSIGWLHLAWCHPR